VFSELASSFRVKFAIPVWDESSTTSEQEAGYITIHHERVLTFQVRPWQTTLICCRSSVPSSTLFRIRYQEERARRTHHPEYSGIWVGAPAVGTKVTSTRPFAGPGIGAGERLVHGGASVLHGVIRTIRDRPTARREYPDRADSTNVCIAIAAAPKRIVTGERQRSAGLFFPALPVPSMVESSP